MISKILLWILRLPPGYFFIAFLVILFCFDCFDTTKSKQQNRAITQPILYHEYYSDRDYQDDIQSYADDQESAREDCGAPCEYGTPF